MNKKPAKPKYIYKVIGESQENKNIITKALPYESEVI